MIMPSHLRPLAHLLQVLFDAGMEPGGHCIAAERLAKGQYMVAGHGVDAMRLVEGQKLPTGHGVAALAPALGQ
jgi:hypothetical protein